MGTLRLLALALLFALAALGFSGPGRADAVGQALARFAADSFNETQKAIEELAVSGHPTAEAVLSALAAERLFVQPSDRAVLFRDAEGALRAAKSGEPAAADAQALKPVRVNNRVRRSLEAAIGSLT